jgi:integrase
MRRYVSTAVFPHRGDTSGTLSRKGDVTPRRLRSADLETRTARLKLPVRKKPYGVQISPGIHLLYRRNNKVGSWSAKSRDGKGGYWVKGFAHADDLEAADGGTVLDFWQAVERARGLARSNAGEGDKPITVAEALDQYEDDLRARSGDVANAARVRVHLSGTLGAKLVSTLTARDLQRFRDAQLGKGLVRDSINRTGRALKAALTLAADRDERIVNRSAWKVGLSALPNAGETRNVIVPDDKVLELIGAAYAIDRALGLLVEVAAVTGARVSQLARLEVQDLQDDRTAPRLTMPSSRKGRGRKIERRPVPIPTSLAAKLKAAGSGRAADAPLLVKQRGARWHKGDHAIPFARAVLAAGLDPAEVTIYALRHSSIVRGLLANVPVRVVAATHDTSVAMIERTYSAHIADHADALSRRALLDLSAPGAGANVVPMVR